MRYPGVISKPIILSIILDRQGNALYSVSLYAPVAQLDRATAS